MNILYVLGGSPIRITALKICQSIIGEKKKISSIYRDFQYSPLLVVSIVLGAKDLSYAMVL